MRTRFTPFLRLTTLIATILAPTTALGQTPYLQPTFPLGSASRLAVADIDHDGDLDWASAGGQAFVSLAKNDGTGKFGPSTPIAMPAFTSGVEFGDMDGDGNVDLVVRTFTSLVVAFGNGSGGFTIHSTLPLAGTSDTRIFAVADVTGDGRPDVLTGTNSANICENDGTGSVTFAHLLAGSNGYTDFAVADKDGDGIEDIVGIGPNLATFTGAGGGIFNSPITSPGSGTRLALFDLDVDARVDAVVLDSAAASLKVMFGSPGGAFGPAFGIPTASLPVGLVVRDLNGDGLVDAATAGTVDRSLQVFLGTGSGFAPALTSFLSGKPADLSAGDWNGDGWTDLAVSAAFGAVSLMNPGSVPIFASNPTFDSNGASAVESADIDQNGSPDLVALSIPGKSLEVYAGDGSGGVASHVSVPAVTQGPGSVSSFSMGDVTGDGISDAIVGAFVAGNGSVVRVMKGNGAGGFPTSADYGFTVPISNSLSSFSIGDFDGDGRNDVAATFEQGTNFVTFLGTASGTLVSGTSGPLSANGLSQQAVGDVDNDGILDLALVADGAPFFTSSRLFVCPGNGHGGFLVSASIDPGASAHLQDVAFADLDGDGNLDVVTTNNSSQLRAHRALGLGTFAAPVVFNGNLGGAAGGHPNTIAALDADGDGYDDVVASGPNALYALCGHAQFALESRWFASGGELAGGLCTYDGNRDGRMDIANLAAITIAAPSRLVLHKNLLPRFFTSYGTGCAGSGGFVPNLALSGTATSSGTVKASLTKGLGGATAILVLGASHAHVPLGMGCFLLTSPLFPVTIALPMQGTGAGNGKLTLSGKLPTPAALGFIDFQAIVLDAGVPWGFCASNAVEMHVQ